MMSDSLFHLLGPERSWKVMTASGMNPLPSPARSTATPAWQHWKTVRTARRGWHLLADVRHQLTSREFPPNRMCWDGIYPRSMQTISPSEYALGEGEVSVRIQHADGRASEIQESIFCGIWRVRCQNDKGNGRNIWKQVAPRALWQAATINTLPDDSLLPPPIDGLMNGLTLAPGTAGARARSGSATP